MENTLQAYFRFIELALDIQLTDNAKNIVRQQVMNGYMSNNVYFIQGINYSVNVVLPSLLYSDQRNLNYWRMTNQPQILNSLRNSYDPMSRVLLELYDQKNTSTQNSTFSNESTSVSKNVSNSNLTSITGLWTAEPIETEGRFQQSYRVNEDGSFQIVTYATGLSGLNGTSILRGRYQLYGSQITLQTIDESFTPERNIDRDSGFVNRPISQQRIYALNLQNNGQVLTLTGLNLDSGGNKTLYRKQENASESASPPKISQDEDEKIAQKTVDEIVNSKQKFDKNKIFGQLTPNQISKVIEKLKELGADQMGSSTLDIASYFKEGNGKYQLKWPSKFNSSAFDKLDRKTQFFVLFSEWSEREFDGMQMLDEGKLEGATKIFEECLARAEQLDVGELKARSYEGMMRVAQVRGDRQKELKWLDEAAAARSN